MYISSFELKNKIETRSSFYLLDVREDFEFINYHLDNSINLPLKDIDKNTISAIIKDSSIDIVVYCRSGIRSQKACDLITALNIKNKIYNLTGGIIDWVNCGYPTIK